MYKNIRTTTGCWENQRQVRNKKEGQGVYSIRVNWTEVQTSKNKVELVYTTRGNHLKIKVNNMLRSKRWT